MTCTYQYRSVVRIFYMRLCKQCGKKADSPQKLWLCRPCYNEYNREYKKKHYEEVKKHHRESRMRLYNASEEQRWKDKANLAVQRAIKKGLLKRGECENCMAKYAHAHHDSYHRSAWLTVRWLCKDCHAAWHRNHEPLLPTRSERLTSVTEHARAKKVFKQARTLAIKLLFNSGKRVSEIVKIVGFSRTTVRNELNKPLSG